MSRPMHMLPLERRALESRIDPVEKLGRLRFVRRSSGDASFATFQCDCGESVIRKLGDVRGRAKRGGVPMCDTCNQKRKKGLPL